MGIYTIWSFFLKLNFLYKRSRFKIKYVNGVISVPLKSGQININQTIPEKGKN